MAQHHHHASLSQTGPGSQPCVPFSGGECFALSLPFRLEHKLKVYLWFYAMPSKNAQGTSGAVQRKGTATIEAPLSIAPYGVYTPNTVHLLYSALDLQSVFVQQ